MGRGITYLLNLLGGMICYGLKVTIGGLIILLVAVALVFCCLLCTPLLLYSQLKDRFSMANNMKENGND